MRLKFFSINKANLSDVELLDCYREHRDPTMISLLYERYIHLVYGLCLKHLKSREDAQDAVMGIFEMLIEKLKTQEVTHFKSWLYIVSKNHCLMLLRKAEKAEKMNGSFMESELSLHLIEEADDLDDDLEALQRCIEELKTDQQRCVRLFYLHQKSYQEIAAETTFKLKKVKSYIQNGKRNLKLCLEKQHVKR